MTELKSRRNVPRPLGSGTNVGSVRMGEVAFETGAALVKDVIMNTIKAAIAGCGGGGGARELGNRLISKSGVYCVEVPGSS